MPDPTIVTPPPVVENMTPGVGDYQHRPGEETPPETKPERPAGLPEGFDTWEQLAAKYAELTAKPAETPPKETPPADQPKPTEPKIEEPKPGAEKTPEEQAAEAKGVDIAGLTSSFMETGKLTDDQYADLATKGFDKATVDEFIGLRIEKAQRLQADLYAEMGGEDTFAAMVGWAKAGLPQSERDAYNAAVDSGDWGRISQAARALKASYENAKGRSPTLINGGNGKSAADAYASMAEYVKDVGDPRYAADPGFRNSVISKLSRSKF